MAHFEWRPAAGTDIDAIVRLTQTYFECEADSIFRTDPIVLGHNVTLAVVNQFYNPGMAFLRVCERHDRLLGYVWAERGQRAVWSQDEMVAIKIVHVDMTLGVRERLRLCEDMIDLWEAWARSISVPIVCSTTMRADQAGFLRLHERRGYDVRGSIAYRRL